MGIFNADRRNPLYDLWVGIRCPFTSLDFQISLGLELFRLNVRSWVRFAMWLRAASPGVRDQPPHPGFSGRSYARKRLVCRQTFLPAKILVTTRNDYYSTERKRVASPGNPFAL